MQKFIAITLGGLLSQALWAENPQNKQGFDTTRMLSNQAVGHNTDTYPKGKVVKTMNVSGYTYFQFSQKGELVWAATSVMDLKEGDQVVLMKSFPMTDFKSKTLNRTFDKILFVSQLDIVK
ncbi:hypothetical protein [Pseudobacteriovorax antillogorgiicola]|uniref:NrfJ n=1 Tax=Pseudobacteriovorax antillogorgiicola TaxID=1513793 RepID=A0A1Y6CCB0_9BACT|nr:hypothetical protein [Pseudobacteriovorax antillogorgiicola]TCS49377.1 hypothetical protein EDD56_11557 [Pseudobacteriovorax antillogorgiicola]SMF47360.1 hypothetical protein SAMN06296036_114127 [Pseudobacteriovorax antillogorgiicola]